MAGGMLLFRANVRQSNRAKPRFGQVFVVRRFRFFNRFRFLNSLKFLGGFCWVDSLELLLGLRIDFDVLDSGSCGLDGNGRYGLEFGQRDQLGVLARQVLDYGLMVLVAAVHVSPGSAAGRPGSPAGRLIAIELATRFAGAVEDCILAGTPGNRLANVGRTTFFCFAFRQHSRRLTAEGCTRYEYQHANCGGTHRRLSNSFCCPTMYSG